MNQTGVERQGEQNEQEIQAPWLNISNHHNPKGPEQRNVQENTVAPSESLQTGTAQSTVVHVCGVFF